MTFVGDGETVVVNGTGFTYFFGFPVSGTIEGLVAEGDINGTISNVSIPVADVFAALEDPDPAAAMIDLVFGGADVFKGSRGSDVIFGFGGNDNIQGGKGADFIVGGAGRDKMSGGANTDTFIFLDKTDSTNKRPDLITDLENADIIDLQAVGARDVRASYDEETDTTTFEVLINGDNKADMTIQANGDQTGFDNFLL